MKESEFTRSSSRRSPDGDGTGGGCEFCGFQYNGTQITEIVLGTNITATVVGGGPDGGSTMTLNVTSTGVARPDKEIVYGTGASVSSEPFFIYDYTNNAVGVGVAVPQLNTTANVTNVTIGGTPDVDSNGYGQLNLVGQWTNGIAMGRLSGWGKITGGTLRELNRIEFYTDNQGPPLNGGWKFFTRRGFDSSFASNGDESLMIDPLGNVRAGYNDVHGPDLVDGYFGVTPSTLPPEVMIPTLGSGAFYFQGEAADLFVWGGDGLTHTRQGWHKPNESVRWTYEYVGTVGTPYPGDLDLRNYGAVHVMRYSATQIVNLHSGGYNEPGKLQILKNNTAAPLNVHFYPTCNYQDVNSTAIPTPVSTTLAVGATGCWIEGDDAEDTGLLGPSYHLLWTTDLALMSGTLPAGSALWSNLGNPAGNLALTMAARTSTFTYNATTGAGVDLFKLTDTAANTGTGALLAAYTAAGSAASPVHFKAGAVDSFHVDSAGRVVIGAAGSTVPLRFAGATSGTADFTAAAVTTSSTYTLPSGPPLADGMTLVSTMAGVWSWTDTPTVSVAWDFIGDPASDLILNMAANTTLFGWGSATGAGVNMFRLVDGAANTGTGAVASIETATGSSAMALQLKIRGNAVFTQAPTTGSIGIGAATAPTARLHVFNPSTNTGTDSAFKITGSNVTYAAAAEHIDVDWVFGTETVTKTSGTITSWRVMRLTPPTVAFTAGAVAITNASTIDITSAPQPGSGATIKWGHALYARQGNVAVADTVTIGTTDYNKNTANGPISSKLIVVSNGGVIGNTAEINAAAGATWNGVWFTGDVSDAVDIIGTTTINKLSWVTVDALGINGTSGAVTVTTAASLRIAGPPAAGASVTITNPYAVLVESGALGVNGTLQFNGSVSGFSAFQAAATTTSVTYTLPTAAPGTNGFVLSGTTAGVLSWVAQTAATTSLAWSALTNPAGNLALTMAANTTTLTYNATTGAATNLFTLVDTASNTGTGYIASVETAASSAALPFQIKARGTAVFRMLATGEISIGAGAAAAGVALSVTGNVAGTGYFSGQSGSASNVTYRVGGSATTGLYGSVADLRIASNGSLVFSSSGSTNDFFVKTGFQPGSIAAPGVFIEGDADTGIHSSAANTFDIIAGGQQTGSFDVEATNGHTGLSLNRRVAGTNALGRVRWVAFASLTTEQVLVID